ncbi:hypothetical protein XBI1_3010009 [Xenorhabdus bovienii str. Intermedium]|uniref:Uncharacterized protein n=1 Tax=Xenorhabdus bovienii str. Intermedium TaxID=1379677 RepID=A0A077QLL0_XENBV|nr:hypothetical protein XBI1_3010009 [Xenorhabdus bovienii str. Intermedium]
MVAAIPEASLCTLANVGHHPTIEAPLDVTDAITEFLRLK